MSFPRYSRYKDSGVEWLGEVPEHWTMKRFKAVFSERMERSETGEELLLSVSAYTGVSPRSEIVEEGEHLSRAESLVDYKICHPRDLVMNIMLAWNRGLGFSDLYGIVSPAYSVFAVIDDSEARFLNYLVRSDEYIRYFKAWSSGVIDSRLRLYPDVFRRLYCALPPITEQRMLVLLLDRETAKIDALIAEQQRLIELLKEKRQAVISHAVTRGLNPDAPMKPSGVEWLGDIPSHWTTTKLKYAASLIVDCPHETPVYSDDGTYLVVRTADVDEGRLDPSSMRRVSEDTYVNRVRRSPVLRDDIVYGREGERWGHAARVPESDRYCLGQRMMQFRAAAGINPGYLMWALNADATYRQGEQDTIGATSPHVNISTIRSFVLALPPEEEQDAIEGFLREHLGRFDDVIDEASLAITLLQERRTALISAAVTGKIDVRGIAMAEAA